MPRRFRTSLSNVSSRWLAPGSRAHTTPPLFILFEDLHWSDEATFECLRVLARRVSVQPILLLVTLRENEMMPALTEWVTQLERRSDVFKVPIAPLDPFRNG